MALEPRRATQKDIAKELGFKNGDVGDSMAPFTNVEIDPSTTLAGASQGMLDFSAEEISVDLKGLSALANDVLCLVVTQ